MIKLYLVHKLVTDVGSQWPVIPTHNHSSFTFGECMCQTLHNNEFVQERKCRSRRKLETVFIGETEPDENGVGSGHKTLKGCLLSLFLLSILIIIFLNHQHFWQSPWGISLTSFPDREMVITECWLRVRPRAIFSSESKHCRSCSTLIITLKSTCHCSKQNLKLHQSADLCRGLIMQIRFSRAGKMLMGIDSTLEREKMKCFCGTMMHRQQVRKEKRVQRLRWMLFNRVDCVPEAELA